MSNNLRHIVKRRVHLERAQPAHRKKLGLLEKKKDYVKRARDYHKKKDYLDSLQEKARTKNPDEFYHKMVNKHIVNGRVEPLKKEDASKYAGLSKEEELLARSSDITYVDNKLRADRKRAEKMGDNLHMLGLGASMSKQIVFDSDAESDSEAESGKRRGRAVAKKTRKVSSASVALTSEKAGKVKKVKKVSKAGKSAAADSVESVLQSGEEAERLAQREAILDEERKNAYAQMERVHERGDKLGNVKHVLEFRKMADAKGRKTKVKLSNGKDHFKFFAKRNK